MIAPECPPDPLEWHPAYRGMTGLLDWLNGDDDVLPPDHVKVAIPRPIRAMLRNSDDPAYFEAEVTAREHVLTKHTAGGQAPFVGDPFMYVWDFATDELGRSIAGEARIKYLHWRPR